jgi:hypothetical protein
MQGKGKGAPPVDLHGRKGSGLGGGSSSSSSSSSSAAASSSSASSLASIGKGQQHPRWIVLLLHSSLPLEEQERAFAKPPDGVRKLILSTNIAGTDVSPWIQTCPLGFRRVPLDSDVSPWIQTCPLPQPPFSQPSLCPTPISPTTIYSTTLSLPFFFISFLTYPPPTLPLLTIPHPSPLNNTPSFPS